MVAQGIMTNRRRRSAAAAADERLPALSWEDVETVLEDMARHGLKDTAVGLTQTLRQEAPNLSALDLLREIILSAATVMPLAPVPETPPAPASRRSGTTSPSPARRSDRAASRPGRRFTRWWPPPSG